MDEKANLEQVVELEQWAATSEAGLASPSPLKSFLMNMLY